MSQNPSPQLPGPFRPDYGRYLPASASLGPARRASALMWILGALGLLGGGAMLLVSAVITPQLIAASEQAPELAKVSAQTGMTIQSQFLIAGVAMSAVAVILIVLAFFVRRGGRGSAMTALVFTGLLTAYMAFNLLGVVLMGGGGAQIVIAFIMAATLLGALLLLCSWLRQTVRAAPAVEAMRQSHRAGAWQPAEMHGLDNGSRPSPITAAKNPSVQTPPGGLPQPGFYHSAYLRPPQAPPGYEQPGTGPAGYGYAQSPRKPLADMPHPATPSSDAGNGSRSNEEQDSAQP